MKQRGFTLVELLVVAIIIAIIAGVSAVGYIQYQNKSSDSQASTLSRVIANAADHYYNQNLEYPTATQLLGASPSNNAPTSGQYANIASFLNIPQDSIKNGKFSIFPCSGTCTLSNTNGDYVFYITKGTAAGSAKTYPISDNGCVFTFPSNENDGVSYFIAYKPKETGNWVYIRSSNGDVATSDSFWCPFK